jgi:hypothetical protein
MRFPKIQIKPDPLGQPRNGYQVLLFAIAIVNGLSILFFVPTSDALASVLDPMLLRTYGGILASAGIAVLLGMFWLGHPVTALFLKRFGYLALFVAVGLYGMAIIIVTQTPGGFLSASFCLAFSLLCLRSSRQVNDRIRSIEEASA